MKNKKRLQVNAQRRERLKMLRQEYALSLKGKGASLTEIGELMKLHKTTVVRILHEARKGMAPRDRDSQRDESPRALEQEIQAVQDSRETDQNGFLKRSLQVFSSLFN